MKTLFYLKGEKKGRTLMIIVKFNTAVFLLDSQLLTIRRHWYTASKLQNTSDWIIIEAQLWGNFFSLDQFLHPPGPDAVHCSSADSDDFLTLPMTKMLESLVAKLLPVLSLTCTTSKEPGWRSLLVITPIRPKLAPPVTMHRLPGRGGGWRSAVRDVLH